MLLFLLNYKTQIIAFFVVLAIITGTYFKGYRDAAAKAELKYNAEVLKIKNDQIDKMTALVNKYNTASESFETYLANQKTITKVIHEKTIKEIEKPVYNMCVVTDDGVRIINETTKQLNATRTNKNTK